MCPTRIRPGEIEPTVGTARTAPRRLPARHATTLPPGWTTSSAILRCQRQAGNQAVARLLSGTAPAPLVQRNFATNLARSDDQADTVRKAFQAGMPSRTKIVKTIGRLPETDIRAIAKGLEKKQLEKLVAASPSTKGATFFCHRALEVRFGIEEVTGFSVGEIRRMMIVLKKLPRGHIKSATNTSLEKMTRHSFRKDRAASYSQKTVKMTYRPTWLSMGGMVMKRGRFGATGSIAGENTFDHTLRHEIGHSVDHKLDVMNRHMGHENFGSWQEHSDGGKTAQAMIAAAPQQVEYQTQKAGSQKFQPRLLASTVEHAFTERPHKDFEESLRDTLEYTEPRGVAPSEHLAAYRRHPAVMAARRVGENVGDVNDATVAAKRFGERYFFPQDKSMLAQHWYSYDAMRPDKISNYQWKTPTEWFAEFYAAYYGRDLSTSHPLYEWFTTNIAENETLSPQGMKSPDDVEGEDLSSRREGEEDALGGESDGSHSTDSGGEEDYVGTDDGSNGSSEDTGQGDVLALNSG